MKRDAFLRRFGTAVLGCGMLADALLRNTPQIEDEEMVTIYEYWEGDEYQGFEVLDIDYPRKIITYGNRRRGKLVGIIDGIDAS